MSAILDGVRYAGERQLTWSVAGARLAHRGPGTMRRRLREVWDPELQIVNQQRVLPSFTEAVEIAPDGEVL